MTDHFPATEITVASRFRGPEGSGNGGWTAGSVAALVTGLEGEDHGRSWPAIEATLRQPPPLDVAMAVQHLDPDDPANTGRSGGPLTVLAMGGARVVEAQTVDDDVPLVELVPADEARAAMASYPGLRQHPFPGCFACGSARAEGDGLRIFPGPVTPAADGAVRVASVWTPHPSTSEDYHAYVDDVPRASLPVTWAALDCSGGWAADLEERMMVLGRMTAEIDALPAIGEEHVIVGQKVGAEGRKSFTLSTMYDGDGRIVGRARHVWIAIDPAAFSTPR
jgi:hypothetical protein